MVYERRRPFVFGIYLFFAAFLLYLGIAIGFVSPGGYHENRFEQAVPLLIFVLPALLLTCRIAWMLGRLELPQLKGFGLGLTLPLSLGLVILGAVLISVAVWRGDWIEVFWRH